MDVVLFLFLYCYPDVGLTRKTSRRDCHYPRPDGPLARNGRHVTCFFSLLPSFLSPGNPCAHFLRFSQSGHVGGNHHCSGPASTHHRPSYSFIYSSIHWELQVLLAPQMLLYLPVYLFFFNCIYIVNNMVFSLVWFRLVWSSLV